ncbi:MAG: DUF4158 domain-containing protein [Pseudonocardiaceae bacterium]
MRAAVAWVRARSRGDRPAGGGGTPCRAAEDRQHQIGSYGRRAQTRTEHLRLVARYLGWRSAGTMEFKELDEFLLARAMEHDSPTLLFRLACDYLISARMIRPIPDTLVRRVAHSREQARETYDRLAHEFTPARCAELDALLVTDASLGISQLRWLSTGPVEASAAAVRAEVDKLAFLRGLGADWLDRRAKLFRGGVRPSCPSGVHPNQTSG